MSIFADEVRIGEINHVWKDGKKTSKTELESHFVSDKPMSLKKVVDMADVFEDNLSGGYKLVVTLDFIET